jgi:hypothetical protein
MFIGEKLIYLLWASPCAGTHEAGPNKVNLNANPHLRHHSLHEGLGTGENGFSQK